MMLKPGDIVLIPFPYSDLSSEKKRPVVVVTAPDRFGDFVAAGITSVEQPENAVELEVGSLLNGRLPKRSWVRTDKLFTLSTGNVVKHFGVLKPSAFQTMMSSICQTIGCIE
jgi:mRNA interferase MazF